MTAEIVLNQTELADAIAARLKAEVLSAVKAQMAGFATTPNPNEHAEQIAAAGEQSFGDFLKAVALNDTRRLVTVYKSTKALDSQSGSGGGFLVPSEFSRDIYAVASTMLFDQLVQAGRGPLVLRTTAGELSLPILRQTGAPAITSSAFVGGVQLYWREQGGDVQESEPEFDQRTFRPYAADAYTAASMELVADAPLALQQYLTRLFAQAYAVTKAATMLRGTGTAQPQGIINHPATISVTRSTNTDPVERDTETVLSMMQRALPGSSRLVWLAHPFWLSRLMQVRMGDTLAYAMTPAGPTLFGVPVFYSEHLPQVTNAGSLLLADLSYYVMVEREGFTVAASEHARFLKRQMVWVFGFRLDGAPLLSAPIILADGSGTNTVSPFVQVAAGT